jgi:thiamine kinase-like enzyme
MRGWKLKQTKVMDHGDSHKKSVADKIASKLVDEGKVKEARAAKIAEKRAAAIAAATPVVEEEVATEEAPLQLMKFLQRKKLWLQKSQQQKQLLRKHLQNQLQNNISRV